MASGGHFGDDFRSSGKEGTLPTSPMLLKSPFTGPLGEYVIIYIYTHTQRERDIYNYIYTYAINMWAGSATRQNTATSLSLQVAVVLFGAGSSWQSVVSGHFPFLPEGTGNLITGQEISLQLQGQSGPTCPMIWIWATPLHSWQPLISSRTSVALVLFALDDLQYI